MRDDFSGLVALVTVAEKKSFRAAAAELRVTPSAVSQTVRALEDRLGVQLLRRTTRSVSLTEAGERFVSRLRPALQSVREAFASIDQLRDTPAGLLRLNVPRVGYTHVLQPRLAQFMAMYPEVRVEICIDDGLVDIVAGGFDAGIRLGETVQRDMVAVRISGDERGAVVGSPAYFSSRATPRHPRDLHAHDCINYRQLARGSIFRWEFTEHGKDFELAVDGRVIVNDAGVVIQAALDGLGLAWVLQSTVAEHVAAKRLVSVLEAWCPRFPGFFLYYPSRAGLAPKLSALIEFLKVRGRKRPAERGP